MYKERKNQQDELILMTMEQMVPEDHLLRKIEASVDLTFINEKTRSLYSQDKGRNCIEPVVLFKIVLLQYLYGIKSMRATIKQCETDASFRWYLGIPFGQSVPHYSTFSQNYLRRYANTPIFEEIFATILKLAMKRKLVSGRDLFSDSTHIRANANTRKYTNQIEMVVKQRKAALEREINGIREELGKETFEFSDESETKHTKVSTIDPQSGYYHRDEKEKGFMYLDHRTVDGLNNFIVDVHITPGNVHDSKPYLSRVDYILNKYGFSTENVGLDSGYYSWEIMEALEQKDIFSAIAYRRFNTNREDRKNFTYDQERDAYICPIGCELPMRNIDKLGYKHYFDKKQCEGCPMLMNCAGKSNRKEIRRHVKQEVFDRARERRLSEHGKNLYARRKTTVERSFADSKQNHGYRYATHRGLAKVQSYAWLSCAAQNMKKMALLLHQQSCFSYSNLKNFISTHIQRHQRCLFLKY
ncbi:MAG: IS1182 family transposase [Erysipelotrichaceae bacterium]|nr:IS1182 family transposase [Erysipelotrichaceae bacterium]